MSFMKALHKTVAATEIKNRFGDYLGEVIHQREPLIIERHGRPVAVLLDYSDWVQGGRSDQTKTPWADACEQLVQNLKKSGPKQKSHTAVDLIRAVRDEEF